MGSLSSTSESPLSPSPTKLATMHRMVSGRSLTKHADVISYSPVQLRVYAPEIPSCGISHFKEEYSRRINDSETLNRRDIMRQNIFRICARVKESFIVTENYNQSLLQLTMMDDDVRLP